MWPGALTVGDWLRLLWRGLTEPRDELAELRARLDLAHRTLDRVIGERDAALAECTRLEAEVARLRSLCALGDAFVAAERSRGAS